MLSRVEHGFYKLGLYSCFDDQRHEHLLHGKMKTIIFQRFYEKKCGCYIVRDGWVDDLRFSALFNIISIISG